GGAPPQPRAADRAPRRRYHRSACRRRAAGLSVLSPMNAVEYCLLHGLKVSGPDHPALLCAGETLSYGRLAARVGQFAAGLREAGVALNDRVGMLMLDTPDIVALHQGAMAMGAIAVAMSSRASPEE